MRALRGVLTLVGTLALVVGLLAGVADRQLLDTSRFVDHADRVRQDPAVARHLGVALSDRLIQEQPDLVAVRPLLEGALQAAVRSPAFRPIFRTGVAPLHQALTGSAPSTVVLQIADAGAVLVGVARTLAPDVADRVPAGVEVQLARLGSGGAGRHTVSGLRSVRLLTWLCPLISLLCFGGVIALARGRRRAALGAVGVAIGLAGVGLALLTVVVTFLAARLLPDTLGGSLVAAGWDQLSGPVRNMALLAAAAGYLLTLAARTSLRALAGVGSGLGSSPAAWRAWLATVQWTDLPVRSRLAVAGAATTFGVLLVLEPAAMLTVLAVGVGLVLTLHGLVGLARIVAQAVVERVRHRREGRYDAQRAAEQPGLRTGVAVTAALAVLVGMVVWSSAGTSTSAAAGRADAAACNGSTLLCTRRYDQVSFPATHNSMAAADQPGWFLAEQPHGVIDQLDAGIRTFLIDTWYGQPTSRAGIVANTDDSQAKALAQAKAEYGADVVKSALRLRDAAGLVPEGPRAAYLCHALCVLGSTAWEPLMVQIRSWLDHHPREVITFILQDEVTPSTTAEVFRESGLLRDVYTPTSSGASAGAWPTLGQMIDSGHRVVVMAENRGGGTRYPWLMSAFHEVQDTPFDARTLSDFSCRLNRGPDTAPLFLVNHWLNQTLRVSASRQANSDAVLGARLDACQKERGLLPNFVAVDNYDQGDLFGQVRRLNGLAKTPEVPRR